MRDVFRSPVVRTEVSENVQTPNLENSYSPHNMYNNKTITTSEE